MPRGCSLREGLPGTEQSPIGSAAACDTWMSPCVFLSVCVFLRDSACVSVCVYIFLGVLICVCPPSMPDMSVASALQHGFSVVSPPSGSHVTSAQLFVCGARSSLCCSSFVKPQCSGGLAPTRRPPNHLPNARGSLLWNEEQHSKPKTELFQGPLVLLHM